MADAMSLARRRREVGPRGVLPYARHISDTVVALDSGALMVAFRLEGAAYETADTADLNDWHLKLNQTWRNLADDRLAIWHHIVRHTITPPARGGYSTFVTEPLFTGLPDALTQAVSGEGVPSVGAAFDEFFAYAAWLGEDISRDASAFNPGPYVVSAGVFIIGALAAALGFGVVLVAKLALALLVTLGPIFIACALFDATRRFFFGWLSQAVNYLVLFALIIVIFQLVLSLVRDQWGAIQGADPMMGGLIFIALCLLGAIFFLQTPAIAAGIAGGASAGLADFANAAALGSSSSGRARGPLEAGRQPPRGGGSIRPGGS